MDFIGHHVLSVDQFARADIERIFEVADEMQPYAERTRITRVLEGAILGSMFFEPSTRTRVSFGCAFNLLGGEVRETTEVKPAANNSYIALKVKLPNKLSPVGPQDLLLGPR